MNARRRAGFPSLTFSPVTAALFVLAFAPPLWAGSGGGGGATGSIQFNSQSPASTPTFTTASTGVTHTTPTPAAISDEADGFSISGFSYTATSTSTATAAGANDLIWQSSRTFSITGSLSITDTVSANVPLFTVLSGKGTLTISVDVSPVVTITDSPSPSVTPNSSNTTVQVVTTYAFSSTNPRSNTLMIEQSKTLPPPLPTLSAGSYQLELVSDLHFNGAGSVSVDPPPQQPAYGANVDPAAVPEPSTLALAAIGALTAAGARWRRRRRQR